MHCRKHPPRKKDEHEEHAEQQREELRLSSFILLLLTPYYLPQQRLHLRGGRRSLRRAIRTREIGCRGSARTASLAKPLSRAS